MQHLWTEIDSSLVLCLLFWAYIPFSDRLVLKLFQRHHNLIVVSTSLILLSVLLICSSSHVGSRGSMKWGSIFMLKAFLIFIMFLWLPSLAALGRIRNLTVHSWLCSQWGTWQKHISYWYSSPKHRLWSVWGGIALAVEFCEWVWTTSSLLCTQKGRRNIWEMGLRWGEQVEESLDVIICRQHNTYMPWHVVLLHVFSLFLIKSQQSPASSVGAAETNFQVNKDKGIPEAY